MSEDDFPAEVVALGKVLPVALTVSDWGDEGERGRCAGTVLEALRAVGWELTPVPVDDAVGRGRWPMSFSCPQCGHAVQDAYGEGWCVVCKAYTGPLPEGLRS